MKITDPREPICGCCGEGQPVNKPLLELAHLIAMLEKQEQERRKKEEANAKRTT